MDGGGGADNGTDMQGVESLFLREGNYPPPSSPLHCTIEIKD